MDGGLYPADQEIALVTHWYVHLWLDQGIYEVVEHWDWGGSRVIPHDQHDYMVWVAAGNIPINEAGGRFVAIVDGQVVIDPNRDAILAAEAAAAAQAAVDAIQRTQDIANNLPSWAQVQTAINNIANLADAKVFLGKLARIVYWLAKNTSA